MKIFYLFLVLFTTTSKSIHANNYKNIEDTIENDIIKRSGNEECKFFNSLLGNKESDDCCSDSNIVQCSDNHVIRISYNSKQLSATMPKSFGSMPYLEFLNLSDNDIKGSIPEDIGELKNLKT
eukprot:jgi/Orpsp1_1/1191977/evm.model.d7180000089774.1